jgi:hypothetical protein
MNHEPDFETEFDDLNTATGKPKTCRKLPSTSTVAERKAYHRQKMMIKAIQRKERQTNAAHPAAITMRR